MDEPPHGLTLSHFTNEEIMRIKTIGILVIAAAVIGGGGYGCTIIWLLRRRAKRM